MKYLNYAESVRRYGPIIDGVWKDEAKWCVKYDVPRALSPSWINSASHGPTTHIYCNRDIVPYLDAALKNVIDRDLVHLLSTFDGCFNIRSQRGATALSTHAFALSIDINSKTNPFGKNGNMPLDLVRCFTDAGARWGGLYIPPRQDSMHYEFVANW